MPKTTMTTSRNSDIADSNDSDADWNPFFLGPTKKSAFGADGNNSNNDSMASFLKSPPTSSRTASTAISSCFAGDASSMAEDATIQDSIASAEWNDLFPKSKYEETEPIKDHHHRASKQQLTMVIKKSPSISRVLLSKQRVGQPKDFHKAWNARQRCDLISPNQQRRNSCDVTIAKEDKATESRSQRRNSCELNSAKEAEFRSHRRRSCEFEEPQTRRSSNGINRATTRNSNGTSPNQRSSTRRKSLNHHSGRRNSCDTSSREDVHPRSRRASLDNALQINRNKKRIGCDASLSSGTSSRSSSSRPQAVPEMQPSLKTPSRSSASKTSEDDTWHVPTLAWDATEVGESTEDDTNHGEEEDGDCSIVSVLESEARRLNDDSHSGNMSMHDSAKIVSTVLPNASFVDDKEDPYVVNYKIKNGVSGRKCLYTGRLSRISNEPSGTGQMTCLETGNVFRGKFTHGHWSEVGSCAYVNGNVYHGRFLDDVQHGPGIMTYADGRRFEGTYAHGTKLEGTMEYQDGSVYVGQFRNGARHGRGTYRFENGSTYTGDFRNDCLHGFGTLTWPTGGCYSGGWNNGVQHGAGREMRSDGSVRAQGVWKHGKLVENAP